MTNTRRRDREMYEVRKILRKRDRRDHSFTYEFLSKNYFLHLVTIYKILGDDTLNDEPFDTTKASIIYKTVEAGTYYELTKSDDTTLHHQK